MQREPIDSTSLLSVGYDESSRTLEVEFRNHRLYRYMDVPQRVYSELLAAESIGRYFSNNIRNSYECWRLVTRPAAAHG